MGVDGKAYYSKPLIQRGTGMLLLQIINGKKAGTEFSARRFPVRVGRSGAMDLTLEEPGIWDEHFQISLGPEGLVLSSHPQALVMVNDQSVSEIPLRNGDLITVGVMKLRFGFTPVRQGNQKFVEWLTWLGLTALCCAQIALIYWLMKW